MGAARARGGGPHAPLLFTVRHPPVRQLEQLGGRIYAIHVPTVDDMEREELVHAPLNYVDNAHDRRDPRPADIRLM